MLDGVGWAVASPTPGACAFSAREMQGFDYCGHANPVASTTARPRAAQTFSTQSPPPNPPPQGGRAFICLTLALKSELQDRRELNVNRVAVFNSSGSGFRIRRHGLAAPGVGARSLRISRSSSMRRSSFCSTSLRRWSAAAPGSAGAVVVRGCRSVARQRVPAWAGAGGAKISPHRRRAAGSARAERSNKRSARGRRASGGSIAGGGRARGAGALRGAAGGRGRRALSGCSWRFRVVGDSRWQRRVVRRRRSGRLGRTPAAPSSHSGRVGRYSRRGCPSKPAFQSRQSRLCSRKLGLQAGNGLPSGLQIVPHVGIVGGRVIAGNFLKNDIRAHVVQGDATHFVQRDSADRVSRRRGGRRSIGLLGFTLRLPPRGRQRQKQRGRGPEQQRAAQRQGSWCSTLL